MIRKPALPPRYKTIVVLTSHVPLSAMLLQKLDTILADSDVESPLRDTRVVSYSKSTKQ